MIASDFARVAVALAFLLVQAPEHLWLAYTCTALLSIFGTFFEAAKNAVIPNITGERDLLAGNALMFSSRFLLMAMGAALGGWTAANVGYRAAFIVNAISFFGSALSVWLIPEQDTQQRAIEGAVVKPEKRPSYWSDIREGWAYIVTHAPVAAIISINILWATGGGSMNLIMDRLGGIIFAGDRGRGGGGPLLRQRAGTVHRNDGSASRRSTLRVSWADAGVHRLGFTDTGFPVCSGWGNAEPLVGVSIFTARSSSARS
jgi:MFS family permease